MGICWKLGTVAMVLSLVVAAIPATRADEGVEGPQAVWLGVLIDDESLDGGVHVVAVVPGGPAELAGLERGDVLLKAAGRSLVRSEDLEGVLSRLTPGDTVRLEWLRGGRPRDRLVELAPPREVTWDVTPPTAPEPAPRAPEVRRIAGSSTAAAAYGFTVAEVTPDLRVYYGAPAEVGVLVTEVRPGRAADRAGLRVGDVLVELGPVSVHRAADVDEALEAWTAGDENVVARVVRDSLGAAVRFDAPGADGDSRKSRDSPLAFEMLERSIEREIDRLNLRIAELERRLERLRDDRAVRDP